jgi:hypothetical protein
MPAYAWSLTILLLLGCPALQLPQPCMLRQNGFAQRAGPPCPICLRLWRLHHTAVHAVSSRLDLGERSSCPQSWLAARPPPLPLRVLCRSDAAPAQLLGGEGRPWHRYIWIFDTPTTP